MDTTLKQRLIGGAVLVALAVIFLPMLVQGPAPDSGVADVSTRVPPTPGGEYETRELPLVPGAADPALPAPATEAAPAPAETAAQDAAAPAAAGKPDPAEAAGQWAVTFGAYASARDADTVLSRLRQAGLEGFKEEAELNGRKAWRVRVGPYPDRALAEAGRLQAVRIRSDVNAQVIALDAGNDTAGTSSAPATAAAATTAASPPAPAASQPAATAQAPATKTEALPAESKPKPAATTPAQQPAPAKTTAATAPAPAPTAPAASGVGFAVQLGAFSSATEANALRDRLRGAGYSAIVQPVRTDKGTLHRVRVGPVASRAEAEQLKSRLASGFGGGMVVPHP
ncbi:SPOR domain-containing protein [Pseudoxanthomonas suwonensis]|uniref:SPOR domain-containing protein n=1 Tax=Pseudoxanthomonas suwonensis TaxID=314722 RepID=UPI00048B16B1|nr:SPOR domain-containing protein [Pseudoxanthomonas suwonensis]